MISISLFEIEINRFWYSDGMFVINILHFDTCDNDAYLFRVGFDRLFSTGEPFQFDILFLGFIIKKITEYREQ